MVMETDMIFHGNAIKLLENSTYPISQCSREWSNTINHVYTSENIKHIKDMISDALDTGLIDEDDADILCDYCENHSGL